MGLILLIVGCSGHNHPKSCRESVLKDIVNVYPDPANLAKALDVICPPVTTIPPIVFNPTTTRTP